MESDYKPLEQERSFNSKAGVERGRDLTKIRQQARSKK
jgi:hypothetical protein